MSATSGFPAKLIRTEIQSLSPYKVQNSKRLIKLDAMENPYEWPASVKEEWLEQLRECSVNRYPDPHATRLKDIIRSSMNVPSNIDILLGNGSDELIQIIALSMRGQNRTLMAPEPSFVMYKMIATYVGMKYLGVPLSPTFELDLGRTLDAIETVNPSLVFIAYPNNPTGNLFKSESIDEIIRVSKGLVVIDEAYSPFNDASYLDHLQRFPNAVVLRTLSKMGLAGLRLGMLFGNRDWLAEFDKIRLPYNINSLSQISAEFALQQHALFDQQCGRICTDRHSLIEQLAEIPGIRPFPSAANFVLCRVPQGKADWAFENLKKRGILIKNMHGSSPLLADCLRITIGKKEENQLLITSFREMFQAQL